MINAATMMFAIERRRTFAVRAMICV